MWEPAWHSTSKKWYFQDRVTGRASWTRPPGCNVELPSGELNAPAPPSDLLPGWEAAWDPAHGRFYFYNHATKERTWDKPSIARGESAKGTLSNIAAPVAPAQVRVQSPLPGLRGSRSQIGFMSPMSPMPPSSVRVSNASYIPANPRASPLTTTSSNPQSRQEKQSSGPTTAVQRAGAQSPPPAIPRSYGVPDPLRFYADPTKQPAPPSSVSMPNLSGSMGYPVGSASASLRPSSHPDTSPGKERPLGSRLSQGHQVARLVSSQGPALSGSIGAPPGFPSGSFSPAFPAPSPSASRVPSFVASPPPAHAMLSKAPGTGEKDAAQWPADACPRLMTAVGRIGLAADAEADLRSKLIGLQVDAETLISESSDVAASFVTKWTGLAPGMALKLVQACRKVESADLLNNSSGAKSPFIKSDNLSGSFRHEANLYSKDTEPRGEQPSRPPLPKPSDSRNLAMSPLGSSQRAVEASPVTSKAFGATRHASPSPTRQVSNAALSSIPESRSTRPTSAGMAHSPSSLAHWAGTASPPLPSAGSAALMEANSTVGVPVEDDREWLSLEAQALRHEKLGLCAPTVAKFVDSCDFVSLGCYCATTRALQCMGLKRFSYPFDWVRSPAIGVIRCLDEKFENFLTWSMTGSGGPAGDGTWYGETSWGGSFWHHDPSDPKTQTEFVQRIQRFSGSMEVPASQARVFLRSVNSSREVLESLALRDALQRALPDAEIYLLIIVDLQSTAGLIYVGGSTNVLVYRVEASVYNDGWTMKNQCEAYAEGCGQALRAWAGEPTPLSEMPSFEAIHAALIPFEGGNPGTALFWPKEMKAVPLPKSPSKEDEATVAAAKEPKTD